MRLAWVLLLVWLVWMAAGCAILSASEKLEGVDLLELVKQENSQGCFRGTLTGSHLGASGLVYVWATWGKSPPDCSKTGP